MAQPDRFASRSSEWRSPRCAQQRWFELSLGLPTRRGGQASWAASVFSHLFLFPSWTDCSILTCSTGLNPTDYRPRKRSAPDGWCDGCIKGVFFCQLLEAKQKYSNLIDGKHFQVQGYGNDWLLTQDQILDSTGLIGCISEWSQKTRETLFSGLNILNLSCHIPWLHESFDSISLMLCSLMFWARWVQAAWFVDNFVVTMVAVWDTKGVAVYTSDIKLRGYDQGIERACLKCSFRIFFNYSYLSVIVVQNFFLISLPRASLPPWY
jgi:hypothetical protein